MRPRGGIIGANITPTQTAASGIWTLREVEAYQRAGAWAALPGAPTSVSGTAGNAQVSLTWSAPAATGGYSITDYAVQYSSNSGSSWTTFSRSASSSTSATVTGLTNGTGYVFRVAAVTVLGTGPFSSASASITPYNTSPTSFAGLQLWLDASDSNSLYGSVSGGSVVSANGAVQRWQDKSGNGRHATQSGASSSPVRKTSIQNGLDVVRFDGSNDVLNLTKDFRWTTTGTHIAVLANPTLANKIWYGFWDGGDNPEIVLYPETYAGEYYSGNGYLLGTASAGHYNAISPCSVRTVTVNNRSYKSYSDGTLKQSLTLGSAISTNLPSDTHCIGGYPPRGSYCAIDICELAIYNVVLSDSDLSSLVSALKSKWGIT